MDRNEQEEWVRQLKAHTQYVMERRKEIEEKQKLIEVTEVTSG